MCFRSDLRNIGGRGAIIDHMNNHHQTLLNMKSMLRISPVHGHVSKGQNTVRSPNHNLIYSPSYSMVRATFRTIAGMKKGGVDHKQPATYTLRKKLSQNKKPNNYAMEEHNKNLMSLTRRMQDIGSPNERRKNPNDPISNPSLFFRRKDEVDGTISLKKFANRIESNTQSRIGSSTYMSPNNSTRYLLQANKPISTAGASRPKTANTAKGKTGGGPNMRRLKHSYDYDNQEGRTEKELTAQSIFDKYALDRRGEAGREEDNTQTDTKNLYSMVKKEVLENIVADRLYKLEDIRTEVRTTLSHYPFTREQQEKLYQEIMDEFQ